MSQSDVIYTEFAQIGHCLKRRNCVFFVFWRSFVFAVSDSVSFFVMEHCVHNLRIESNEECINCILVGFSNGVVFDCCYLRYLFRSEHCVISGRGQQCVCLRLSVFNSISCMSVYLYVILSMSLHRMHCITRKCSFKLLYVGFI